MTLQELFAGRAVDIPSVMARLKSAAADCGLPFGERTMTFNSRRAQELGKWAESQGKGNDYHHAVFRAYFAEGLNIGKSDVLVKLTQGIGLDGQTAEQVLLEETYSAAVDRDWSYSRSCGITAVPTFIVNGHKAVGAQPYELLAKLVTEA